MATQVYFFFLECYHLLLHPILTKYLGIDPWDGTFGRKYVPFSMYEELLDRAPYATWREWCEVAGKDEAELGEEKEEEGTGEKKEGELKGRKGPNVFWQCWWKEEGEPSVDVVVVHGLNDYGGRFSDLAPRLIDQGIRVSAVDLPGFGRSDGVHGHIGDVGDLVGAVGRIVGRLGFLQKRGRLARSKSGRVFLLGSSLGGHVVTRYAIERGGVDGICLLSPLTSVGHTATPGGSVLLRVAQGLRKLLPTFPIVRGKRGQGARYLALMKLLEEDSLYYNGRMRIATGLAIKESVEAFCGRWGEIRVALSVDHGDADEIVRVEGSRDLVAQSRSTDKRFCVHSGGDHSLLRGWSKGPLILDGVARWIRERCT